MMRKLIYITYLLFLGNNALCQDILSGFYTNLKLQPSVYTISGVLTIDSILEIEAGARLYFQDGASIIINNQLQALGTEKLAIRFSSLPGQKGNGLIFKNSSTTSIQIKFAQFENLLTPLIFDKHWFRSSVVIENSVFKRNKSPNSIVTVLRPSTDNKLISINQQFHFSKNLITENESPVYFEDFSSDNLQIELEENVFYNNRFVDYGTYNFSSNILFGRADKFASSIKPIIKNNSFIRNLLIDAVADTIIQEANMGVYGTDDSLIVSKNYWGHLASKNISLALYDYFKNYKNPKLFIDSFLSKPLSSSPAHVYKVVTSFTDTVNMSANEESNLIGVHSNKIPAKSITRLILLANKIVDFSKTEIHWINKTDSMAVADKIIKYQLKSNSVGVMAEFVLDSSSFKSSEDGYLEIVNVQDLTGQELPRIDIGFESYLKNIYLSRNDVPVDSKEIATKNSLGIKQEAKKTFFYKRKIEAGLVGYMGIYYGTLSNKKLFKNDANGGYGLLVRYTLTNNIAFCLSAMKFSLSGSDLNSNDTAKIARGMSFKSPILGGHFMLEYYFNNLKQYAADPKIIPGFGLGVEFVQFNPQGIYKGIWYDLQKIGTAGQTIAGTSVQPYQLTTLGIPMSVNLRMPVNKHTVVNLFGQYHFLFTNYLDDVGADAYVSPLQIQSANPSNEEAALYFSNPSRRLLKPGQLRSATDDTSDGYFVFGINVNYHF